MGADCRPPEQLGITPSWEGEGERDGGHFTATKTVLTTNIIFFLAATLTGNFPFGAATFYSESLRLTFFFSRKDLFFSSTTVSWKQEDDVGVKAILADSFLFGL